MAAALSPVDRLRTAKLLVVVDADRSDGDSFVPPPVERLARGVPAESPSSQVPPREAAAESPQGRAQSQAARRPGPAGVGGPRVDGPRQPRFTLTATRSRVMSDDDVVLLLPYQVAPADAYPARLFGRSCASPVQIGAALADSSLSFFTVPADEELVRHAASRAPQDDEASKAWFVLDQLTPARLPAMIAVGAYRVGLVVAERPAGLPWLARSLMEPLRELWAATPSLQPLRGDFHPPIGQ
ncbi:MAG: hypothetical protein LBR32_06565 [Propionibacteriaceae bacterium]|nr:hypothetical protein [Propionibacteriaceae bacterium]